MAKIRKRLAIAFARSFAAGLVENAEVELQEVDLSENEFAVAHEELLKISRQIEATVNADLLAELN